MTLSNAYLTLAEFKDGLEIQTAVKDALAEEAIEAASRKIDDWCGRRFYKDTAATARVFHASSTDRVYTADMSAAPTAVKTDDGDTGSFATTWSSSDYVVEPQDGIGPNGQSGWPYTSIVAVLGRTFPMIRRPNNVQVTAIWGWAAVPIEIKSTCRRLAQMLYEARLAPFGVTGYGDIGAIRIRTDLILKDLPSEFIRKPILIA